MARCFEVIDLEHLRASTKKNFMAFYFDEMSLSAFKCWLRSDSELHEEIGHENYSNLINFNNNLDVDGKLVKTLIEEIYTSKQKSHIAYDRALSITQKMLNGEISLKKGCKILADMEMNGYDFIPPVFDGYDSEMDRLNNVDFYKEDIIADAKKLYAYLSGQE